MKRKSHLNQVKSTTLAIAMSSTSETIQSHKNKNGETNQTIETPVIGTENVVNETLTTANRELKNDNMRDMLDEDENDEMYNNTVGDITQGN